MDTEKFAGDKKVGKSILADIEAKFIQKTLPFVPKFLETYHLTLMTIVWSGLIALFGYLAQEDRSWFHLISVMVFMQYLSDVYDGKVGRLKNTGLIKWGFYMDHFLDYIFLGSILTAYSFQVPPQLQFYGFLTALFIIGLMMNSYLAFSATNQFKIAYLGIGATEGRLLFILATTLIIIFGFKYLLIALPYLAAFSFLGLALVVFRKQRQIWKIDMEEKARNTQ